MRADAVRRRRSACSWRWRSSASAPGFVYPLKQVTSVASLGVVYLLGCRHRVGVLGALARGCDVAPECGGVQLLSPAAGRPFHDRRQPKLGCAGRVLRRRGRDQHRQRARASARGRGRAAPRRGGPDRGDGAAVARPHRGRGRAGADRPAAGAGVRAALGVDRARGDGRRCPAAGDPAVRGGANAWERSSSRRTCLRASWIGLRDRVVPALSAMLGMVLERERLVAEAVQTEGLRRSEAVKTAVLRAVSHDLRSPVTAMIAAGSAVRAPELTPDEREELGRLVVDEGARLATADRRPARPVEARGAHRRPATGGMLGGGGDRRGTGGTTARTRGSTCGSIR